MCMYSPLFSKKCIINCKKQQSKLESKLNKRIIEEYIKLGRIRLLWQSSGKLVYLIELAMKQRKIGPNTWINIANDYFDRVFPVSQIISNPDHVFTRKLNFSAATSFLNVTSNIVRFLIISYCSTNKRLSMRIKWHSFGCCWCTDNKMRINNKHISL